MNKCNISVSELCIRAGFKAVVYAPNRRYMQANALAPYGSTDASSVEGDAVRLGVRLWGRKRTPAFRQAFLAPDAATPVADAACVLNELIAEHGRVVLLAMRRQDMDTAGKRNPDTS